MQILPYLAFDGRCREAFEFYRDALGAARLDVMTYADAPESMCAPGADPARVMHACLQADGAMLMGADMPADGAGAVSGDCINLMVGTAAEAERIWARLAEGAQVRMPLEPTFWAERFGMLVDRFGKAWMVNCMAADADCGDTA